MANYSSGAVPCWEVQDGYSEQIGRDGWNPSVTVGCDWADRYLLYTDIVGSYRPWPYAGGPNPPRAQSATITGFGPIGLPSTDGHEDFQYEEARLQIQYGQLEIGVPGVTPYDAFSETLSPTFEFRNLSHLAFRWGSTTGDPLEREESPGRLLIRSKFQRTYYGLTSLPTGLITLLGHANNSNITSAYLGLTFPTDTLLFLGGAPSRTIKSNGTGAWTLPIEFAYQEEGWNSFWRQKSSAFEQIYHETTGLYLNYPQSNLSGLFL